MRNCAPHAKRNSLSTASGKSFLMRANSFSVLGFDLELEEPYQAAGKDGRQEEQNGQQTQDPFHQQQAALGSPTPAI
jgi:hypothetical protein